MLLSIEKGIAQLEKTIKELIQNDEQLRTKVDKITAIKGVGLKTVAVLIAETVDR